MAAIYARWIKAGRMTIAQVPACWRDVTRGIIGEA